MTKMTDEQAAAFFEATDDPVAAGMVAHDVSEVAWVAAAVANRDAADEQVLAAVRDARARGVPWVLIASALGVSYQAAHKKYRHLVDPVPAG
ncbi:MAG: hypothetical protein FWF02_09330 [Micrococcales bacterium]|nr:hypothetical protein [Micrococcales bacterium]MCL2667891.1 hypothetical protein [Micrococcales bacterium]